MSAKDASELKALQVRRDKAHGELRSLQDESAQLQQKIGSLKAGVAELNRKIDSFNTQAEPTVSEHAMLRFCERVLGYDLENIRKAILTPETIQKINFMGTGKINHDGHQLIIKNRCVVTVE